ncbi:hypothetical protein CHU98_g722 [Xylaria longipes]|nr:hypothetical protein CHU98_g722 [Xylaria longipes]
MNPGTRASLQSMCDEDVDRFIASNPDAQALGPFVSLHRLMGMCSPRRKHCNRGIVRGTLYYAPGILADITPGIAAQDLTSSEIRQEPAWRRIVI